MTLDHVNEMERIGQLADADCEEDMKRLMDLIPTIAPLARAGLDADHFAEKHYELIDALNNLPELPNPRVLKMLGEAGKWPEDWEEGKRIQRERDLEAVPPKTECEVGAGFWHRVIQPVPSPPEQS